MLASRNAGASECWKGEEEEREEVLPSLETSRNRSSA
jgi:hypothetical protein